MSSVSSSSSSSSSSASLSTSSSAASCGSKCSSAIQAALQKLNQVQQQQNQLGQNQSSSSFVAMMDESANCSSENSYLSLPAFQNQADFHTNKGAASFESTDSHRLDYFFKGLVRGTSSEKIRDMCRKSWAENPEDTIKLIQYGRDPRNGKGEKAVSLESLMWLRQFKPLTYLLNLDRFLHVGCFKDLLKIVELSWQRKLPILGETDFIELEIIAECLRDDRNKLDKMDSESSSSSNLQKSTTAAAQTSPSTVTNINKVVDEDEDAGFVIMDATKNESSDTMEDIESVAAAEESKHSSSKKTTESVGSRSPVSITLAAKWAPTEGHHFDTSTDMTPHMSERLAKLLFYPQCADNSYRLKLYRKLLARLRTHLQIVERLMCQNRWSDINYSQIPSRAHHLLKKALLKHDYDRYRKYQQDVLESLLNPINDKLPVAKIKINTKGLQPHELVDEYLKNSNNTDTESTLDAQWQTMIQTLRGKGTLGSAVAVVDSSGSMTSRVGSTTCWSVAVALGLVCSELASGPFQNHCITFSDTPSWHAINTAQKMVDRINELDKMEWHGTTNLQAVFDLILNQATKHRIAQDQMAKMLLIISDMQFDACATNSSYTNFQEMSRKYHEHGYAMPRVVFWNVNGAACHDTPVKHNEIGVCLLSGFSAEILNVLLSGEIDTFTPISMMEKAISQYSATIETSER